MRLTQIFCFGRFFVFLGLFLLSEKKKKPTPDRLTDPTWQVRPPVKQGFFFFFFSVA